MRLTRAAVATLVCSLAFSLAGVTRAAPPNGVYAIDFGPENSVWGGQPFQADECDGSSCIALDVGVDPAGKLSGTVSYTDVVDVNGVPGDVETHGDIKGRATGKAGHSKFKVSSLLRGAVTMPLDTIPLRGKLLWTVEPDALAGTVTNSARITVCARGHCGHGNFPAEVVPLLAEDGGPWHLSLDLATDSMNRVTGSATATFEDGSESIEFAVTGKYSAKKDEASVNLASTLPGSGARVRLRHLGIEADSLARYVLTFKVRGQSGGLTVPPP
jgi:hypothetical protein